MLDVKVIREKTEWVSARLAARNAGDEANIQEIIALDDARRKNLSEVEVLRAHRNKVSKEIGVLMGKKQF
ncbi:MAG TPA: serine--tRNA ligase, partial [Verrucomicrobiota bacterium]|nr:serine--tRNA ligase [Verrucomicrobiota bacterium]